MFNCSFPLPCSGALHPAFQHLRVRTRSSREAGVCCSTVRKNGSAESRGLRLVDNEQPTLREQFEAQKQQGERAMASLFDLAHQAVGDGAAHTIASARHGSAWKLLNCIMLQAQSCTFQLKFHFTLQAFLATPSARRRTRRCRCRRRPCRRRRGAETAAAAAAARSKPRGCVARR